MNFLFGISENYKDSLKSHYVITLVNLILLAILGVAGSLGSVLFLIFSTFFLLYNFLIFRNLQKSMFRVLNSECIL
jgi:hypothetical protein|tara:strand:+ start:9852 stop:10079 length:228 start_codon:yes stop_codon:yes gene_type:complete